MNEINFKSIDLKNTELEGFPCFLINNKEYAYISFNSGYIIQELDIIILKKISLSSNLFLQHGNKKIINLGLVNDKETFKSSIKESIYSIDNLINEFLIDEKSTIKIGVNINLVSNLFFAREKNGVINNLDEINIPIIENKKEIIEKIYEKGCNFNIPYVKNKDNIAEISFLIDLNEYKNKELFLKNLINKSNELVSIELNKII